MHERAAILRAPACRSTACPTLRSLETVSCRAGRRPAGLVKSRRSAPGRLPAPTSWGCRCPRPSCPIVDVSAHRHGSLSPAPSDMPSDVTHPHCCRGLKRRPMVNALVTSASSLRSSPCPSISMSTRCWLWCNPPRVDAGYCGRLLAPETDGDAGRHEVLLVVGAPGEGYRIVL